MGRMIGYARVSTSDQDVSLQWEALRRAGCQEPQIFCDTASGAHTARPGLEACLRALAPGDLLVVWRLDRLGRSMTHLVTMIEELLGRQVDSVRFVMGRLIRPPPQGSWSSISFPRWHSLSGG